MRKRLAIIFVLVLCGGALVAAPAQATISKFLTSTRLNGGENGFGGYWKKLSYVYGGSVGAAASCVGAREHPTYQVCGGEYQEVSTGYIGFSAQAYLHNHSTWTSYFNAYQQGEP
jgi:hypothetical protein